MAFCGQCGLLLNTNITRCPRCGTEAHPDAAMPGIPTNDNAATIIAQTDGSAPYTPPPPAPEIPPHETTKAVYYTAPRPSQPGFPQSDNSYPTPETFDPGFLQSGGNYTTPGAPSPNALPGGYNQAPAPGIYPPGVFPTTDPGYPFQYTAPPHKTHKGLIAIIIVLLVALSVVTGLLFAVGSNRFAGLFGTKSTPIALVTPTTQPVPTITPNTQPTTTATQQTTPTAAPTQQAQTTIQLYYDDINNQNFHDAYYLWVSNPDTYDHFQQGFAHTHHDAITLGDAIVQTDGTVQVNLTVQATEDTTGGGTQVSVYHGYYTVGQQADGSWKIINGQLS